MNDLLASIIDAHGGLDRWRSLEKVEATIVTRGDLWGMKGLVQDADPRRMHVWLHDQRACLMPFGDPDWHTEYVPDWIAIVRSDGNVVQERSDPRASFGGHVMDTPWDPLHRAYFNGYALWNYLTMPFLLAGSGVEVTELKPWNNDGETWRVLRACFPAEIATHSREQHFYFGADLMLRRHDYQVDVAGSFDAAQVVHDYIEADGIRLPSKRRAYRRRLDGAVERDTLLVSIDISDVCFS